VSRFAEYEKRSAGALKKRRRQVEMESVARCSLVSTAAIGSFGAAAADDEFAGDVGLRDVRAILRTFDLSGYERSADQAKFHDAYLRACARVLYRDDWSTSAPRIMEKNEWTACPSEILISTPRRFGKTFSVAMFCAAMALAQGCEIVVFSETFRRTHPDTSERLESYRRVRSRAGPARRASRKLLER
jgi:hypothetical protein